MRPRISSPRLGSRGGVSAMLPPRGPSKQFYAALGEFIVLFASVEGTLYRILLMTSGADRMVARAIFTDARIDKAKDWIKRMRSAKGLKEDNTFEAATKQLSEIAKMRNDIMHYGIIWSNEYNSLIVSNNGIVHTPSRVRESAISIDILESMGLDLCFIIGALTSMLYEPPIYDIAKPDTEDDIGKPNPFRLPLNISWQYKWQSPSRLENNSRDTRQLHTLPPLPSP